MEKNYTATNEEIEINFGELFHEIWRNFWMIFFSALIGAMLGYLLGKTLVTPKFSSTTKIYVRANEENSNTINTGELQAGALLTKDYEQVIESREVTESVIARLQLKSGDDVMTHQELLSKMSVNTPKDTRVVSITIKDSDPYIACDIANAVRDVAMEQIQSVMDMESVKVVEEANIPTKPDNISATKIGLVGGGVGALLAIVISAIVYMSNNTIRTSEDIERYLGLSNLGTIPFLQYEKKHKKKGGKKK